MRQQRDGRYDRDGNRIENPIPGNPSRDPNAPGPAELEDMERARSYRWHKNAGTLPVHYAIWGGAPPGYLDQLNAPAKEPGRNGRDGR